MPQAAPDMFDEALQTISGGGPADTLVAPKADMGDEAVARLRPDVAADRLAAGPQKGNSKGFTLDSPGWGMGASILNGMTQGHLPQLAAGVMARPFVQTTPEERATARADYERRLGELQAVRANYEEQHGGKAAVGEIGGSMSTLIPAMATGAGELGAAAQGLTRVAPWLSGVTDFLSGASKVRELKLASQAVRGGIEGATAAAASSGLSDSPLSDQMRTGGLAGLLLGPAGGYLSNRLGTHVTPTTAETAQGLLDQGIALRAGDIPGSGKVTQGLNKVFGGGMTPQREQFATALTGHAGMPEKEVSQGWVSRNDQRIGRTMNNIQSVYSIPQLEPGLLHDLSAVRSDAISNMSVDNAQKVSDFVRKIEDNTFSDMNGATYKNITQKGGILDNMSKDKDIASAVPQIREALDDAWGRALPADKKAAWDQARREYKVTRTIDDSMGASGAAEGVYNPKKLLKAVEDRYGNVENAGDLGMLARGGQFLEPPGAAPASAKHGAAKTIGTLALGGAAATAASEGSHVLTHWGPEALAALSSHPETMALPLALAGGIYGAGKAANAALNGPRATQYLLDVSRGSRAPMLRGNNPLIPFAVESYNRQ